MHPLGTRSRKSSAPAHYQRNASHGSKDWASVMRSVDQQLPTMDLEQVLEAAIQVCWH